jgi:hypothetical protein
LSTLRRVALAVWAFVVGDDWRTALGVVVGLGLTAVIAHHTSIAAWWITPVVVVALLALSLGRARARARARADPQP